VLGEGHLKPQRRPAEAAAARVASGNARVLNAIRDGPLLPWAASWANVLVG